MIMDHRCLCDFRSEIHKTGMEKTRRYVLQCAFRIVLEQNDAEKTWATTKRTVATDQLRKYNKPNQHFARQTFDD